MRLFARLPLLLPVLIAHPAAAHSGLHAHPQAAAPILVAMLAASALGVLTRLILRHPHR